MEKKIKDLKYGEVFSIRLFNNSEAYYMVTNMVQNADSKPQSACVCLTGGKLECFDQESYVRLVRDPITLSWR